MAHHNLDVTPKGRQKLHESLRGETAQTPMAPPPVRLKALNAMTNFPALVEEKLRAAK